MIGRGDLGEVGFEATIALGFIMLVGLISGKLVTRLKLPQITGYILAGILFGPYVLQAISMESVRSLRLIDQLALGLIALTAGGELKLASLRTRLKSILSISFMQVVVVFTSMTVISFLVRPLIPSLAGVAFQSGLAAALLFGMIAVAKSPATTIALITEYKARGTFTDTILGVTIIKDVIILILFTATFAISQMLDHPEGGFHLMVFIRLVWEIIESIGIGFLIGAGITIYIKRVKAELPLFILAVAFLCELVAEALHIEFLLMSMAAGFYIENFSEQGEQLIEGIERSSLPIYIIFFAIAGASLNLIALRQMWLVALLMVVGRAIFTHLATDWGSRVVADEPKVRRYGGLGFLSQAGVTLGLSIIVERNFPVWGADFKTIVIAIIALNQLIGPVAFRFALVKSGECQSLN